MEKNKTVPTEPRAMENHVRVRIEDARRNEDGTWTLVILGRQPSEEERKMLGRLFPTTIERAYHLMTIEHVVASIEEDR